jgi:hypothetical protein
MSSKSVAQEIRPLTKRMVQYLSRALIFFTLAWAFLTIGVFTFNPVGPGGIFFLCIGLPCVAISIFYFVRYWLISKKIRKLLA